VLGAGTLLAAALLSLAACQDPTRPAPLAPAARPARALAAAPLQPWELEDPATSHEIEGYASAPSVNTGESIDLLVNTASKTYTVAIYRMGWYGGAGAQLVLAPVSRPGFAQPAPTTDATTGLTECQWTHPYTVRTIGWQSGVYLAKLTTTAGKSSYVIFVVRDDARASKYLMQISMNTYQAYNFWGGLSIYGDSLGGSGRAVKVSFNRPFAKGVKFGTARGVGAGEFLTTLAGVPPNGSGWEYNMVRFLEREGYDVTNTTHNHDAARPQSLLTHRALLVVGHDEYWTMAQRNAIVGARDAGVHLGFFSANTGYWHVRFEPARDGTADRTMVSYKERYLQDPLSGATPTIMFRQIGLPENEVLGVMYGGLSSTTFPFVISDASTWVTAGTGATAGMQFVGLTGSETDVMFGTVNPTQQRFGHACMPNTVDAWQCNDATTYVASSGATVVAFGTFQWSWGLDDYDPTGNRPAPVNAVAQAITRNVLARFATAPAPRPVAAVSVVVAPSTIAVGGTSQATATLTDDTGNVVSGRTIAWASSDTRIARVSSTGVVTASKVGTVFITATSEGKSGSATLNVVR
jgi:hypothetical protein